ncbi:MAG: LysR family transcriptional regulator [Gammaproteobacteria bacterium]|jgi:DNA-binding transcriptional LysR family regulator|nr:LysR family transcriptional regulator [Gammaproteobacteria bacterium]MCP4879339.1 LysR family transcriptional regulator [Gammaproteobacteria bacterium]MDP6165492.1 LysR family transcriptional regulator [Gammaproteobacteria bacterium]
MDTQQLQAFVTVARLGSFSQAAEQLYLTQPAISKRIDKLEQQLTTRLFDRIGRHINLTDAGLVLLPRAQHILATLDDTARELNNLSGKVTGQLRIATSHHIGLHRLPPHLRAFQQHFPQVKLDIQFAESEKIHQGLLEGLWEIGIVTLNPRPHPKLQQQKIWQDAMHFVCAPHHPLAQSDTMSLASLSDYPALLSKPGTFTRELLTQRFDDAHIELQVATSTNNLDTLRMLVSTGMGWSLLPHTLLDQDILSIATNTPTIERNLGCVWHHQRSLSNAAQHFMTHLQT